MWNDIYRRRFELERIAIECMVREYFDSFTLAETQQREIGGEEDVRLVIERKRLIMAIVVWAKKKFLFPCRRPNRDNVLFNDEGHLIFELFERFEDPPKELRVESISNLIHNCFEQQTNDSIYDLHYNANNYGIRIEFVNGNILHDDEGDNNNDNNNEDDEEEDDYNGFDHPRLVEALGRVLLGIQEEERITFASLGHVMLEMKEDEIITSGITSINSTLPLSVWPIVLERAWFSTHGVCDRGPEAIFYLLQNASVLQDGLRRQLEDENEN